MDGSGSGKEGIKMKEKQNRRWGLMILSLLCGFLVWLGAVNIADPVITDTVEVPIEIINDEVLTENGLTYEIIGRRTATISYEVKTTDAYRIRSSDFRAVADMTELWSVTGSIPVEVEVLSHSEYLVSDPVSRTATIKIETEPVQEKQFILQTTFTGTIPDGYAPGTVTLSPQYLTLKGPESLIGQISSAGIEINLDNVTEDVTAAAIPEFYDANGNEIQLNDRIESDCEAVEYTLTVLRVKNVNLEFEVHGEPEDGYRFTGVQCSVTSVPVMGLRTLLASLQTITIPGDSLDITGASSNVTVLVDLNEYLPEGIELAGMQESTIEVTMLIEKLETREYEIAVTDASLTGKAEHYRYESDPGTISVWIRALPEELDSLTFDSSDISIDVSEMGEGDHYAAPQLAVELDSAYKLVNSTGCVIRVIPLEGPGDAESVSAEDASSQAEADGQASGNTANGTHTGQTGETAANGMHTGQTGEAAANGTHTGQAGETAAGAVPSARPQEAGETAENS